MSAALAIRPGRTLRMVAGYLRRRPIWCTWQVTRRCGSVCVFCDHRAEGGSGELDLPGITRVSDQLARLGSLVVSLSGGEPFLRQDLPDIVATVARHHFPILTTHGWLVTPRGARAVWEAGLEAATVRMEDPDPAVHDSAAGVRGSWDRAVAAMGALAAARVRTSQRVNVKMRVKGGDPERVERALDLAAQHGATLTVEVLAGGGGSPASAGLLQLKRRRPSLISGSAYLRRADEALAGGVGGCQAARAFLNVDHRGRVSKCVEYQGVADRVGDFLNDDAEAVLARLHRVADENACRGCFSASRGEVEALYTPRGLAAAVAGAVRS